MCGIAGILGTAADERAPLLSLAHRGPDDSGWTTHPAHHATGAFHSVLLHRRLSILDLSHAGHQPMATADGHFTITYNGEIYNYRELRDELASLGVEFHTASDTEVLLQAYIRWGAGCLNKLIGMFAFAIHDARRRTLFLARDCFGIKPLYYWTDGQKFAFASEIKALLNWLPIKRSVETGRLYEYLRYGTSDHGERTMWRDIKQVPAAHHLEVPLDKPGTATLTRYWDLAAGETLDISFDEAVARVRELFLQNIRLHLRSDVPVGAALSGGIDSSAIVAAMRVVEPKTEIHAFSYIADGPVLNEERWVDLVVGHSGAQVHKVHASSDELVADLEHLIYTQDEPFGSTSIYAQYRVFRLAAEHGIKVMLDGQGADELLAGYHAFVPARLASLVRCGRLFEAHQFASNAARSPGMRGRARLWLEASRRLAPRTLTRLAERWRTPTWLNTRWFAERGVDVAGFGAAAAGLAMDLRQSVATSSLPMLLRYEDRNSMAASIESRVPFLTPAFADFVLRLPEEYILANDGTSKCVFRAAMRGIVPDAILDRRDKIGFATPEKRWLESLRPWVDRALASERARAIPALNLAAVQREWDAVREGRARFDFRVWRWVNLIKWAERFDVEFV
jgi:asparagine synthase (glutamine-hydrolysing)